MHLWKSLSCDAVPPGKGRYPAGPWRPGSFLLPLQNVPVTVLGSPRSLATCSPLPPRHLSWAGTPAVSLSLALLLAGQCQKPPELHQGARPPPPAPNPLVKGGGHLVRVCLLAWSRALAHTGGRGDAGGGAPPPPAAGASARRPLWGRDKDREGSRSCGTDSKQQAPRPSRAPRRLIKTPVQI